MPANQRYSSVKNVCENLTLQEIVHVGIHDDQSFNGSCKCQSSQIICQEPVN